jgi:hypothetical protein
LVGAAEGCPPLELPADACLRLHYNGTRLARWDANLGLVRHSGAAPFRATRLAAVRAGGGLVPRLDVVVLRAYGWQFSEGGWMQESEGWV